MLGIKLNMNVIRKIKPPELIRYLFFISYSLYRRYTIERYNAHNTAILFLSFGFMLIHTSIIGFTFGYFKKPLLFIVFLIVFIQFYVWFWHKHKWKLYIEEFKYVSIENQKKHSFLLIIYAISCIVIASLPIILKEFFDMQIWK